MPVDYLGLIVNSDACHHLPTTMNAFTKYIYFGEHVNQYSPTSTQHPRWCKLAAKILDSLFMLAVLKTNDLHLGVTPVDVVFALFLFYFSLVKTSSSPLLFSPLSRSLSLCAPQLTESFPFN